MAHDDRLPLALYWGNRQFGHLGHCQDHHFLAAALFCGYGLGPGALRGIGQPGGDAGLDRAGLFGAGGHRRQLQLLFGEAGGFYRREHHPPPAQLPLRPHPAPELPVSQKDPHRRDDRALHLGRRRAAALLQRPGNWHWAGGAALHHQLCRAAAAELAVGAALHCHHTADHPDLDLVLQARDQSL